MTEDYYEPFYNKIHLSDFEKSLLSLSSSVRIGAYKGMRFAELDWSTRAYFDSEEELQVPSYLMYAYERDTDNTTMLTTDSPVEFYEALRDQFSEYKIKKVMDQRKILEKNLRRAQAELNNFNEENGTT